MSVYDQFGVVPIINVAGAMTRYGGALVDPQIETAMVLAGRESVRLDELEAAASRMISRLTHAEGGIVTCGASAALTLGVAACIAKLDVSIMNRLPNTCGLPDEVVMPWHQISGYDHSILAAGGKLIGVGTPNDTSPPHVVSPISWRQIEAAITTRTAAIAYAARPSAHPRLEDIVSLAHRRGLPVIVDAAAEVPPLHNLHRFVDIGADLVSLSGGKGIRGPQASGILCGRADLVSSALLQMLDMAGEPYEDWDPRRELIPKDQLCDRPLHGIGRGMKVTKEAVVGLLTALASCTEEHLEAILMERREVLSSIADCLEGVPGLRTRIDEPSGRYPLLELAIDASVAGKSAKQITTCLRHGRPIIYVDESRVEDGVIGVDSLNVDRDIAELVRHRLREVVATS